MPRMLDLPSYFMVLCRAGWTILLLALTGLTVQAQEPVAPPHADPPEHVFLWKVEKPGHATSYLFGTMHSGDPRVTAIHPDVTAALDQADALYVELTPHQLEESSELLEQAVLLPEGQRLQDLLSAQGLKDLATVLARIDLTVADVESIHPEFLDLMLLEMLYETERKLALPVLDDLLFEQAERAGKEVGGIETVEEQMRTLPIHVGVHFLEQGLRREVRMYRPGSAFNPLEVFKTVYLSGSEEELLALALGEIDLNSDEGKIFLQQHLMPRNRNMATRSAALMRENPERKYLFAYGTLHFLGKKSVVTLLEKEGFQVTRLLAPSKEVPAWDLSDLGYTGD